MKLWQIFMKTYIFAIVFHIGNQLALGNFGGLSQDEGAGKIRLKS
jgi:hypothetical protein